MMLTPETLQRIRRIDIRTRRLVNRLFAGAYHSVFKGRGIAFESVRPYQPGDDVRDIDWNVTARTNEAFVKQFMEERELTVMLVLDSSASCLFGTVDRSKRDVAAELGAVLALTAIKNNDQVGLLVFSDRIEHFTAPRKGRNHGLRLIRDLLVVQAAEQGTDLSLAMRTVNRLLRQRSVVFILSDFLSPPMDYVYDLQSLSRRHDVIAVVLTDPLEARFPNVGLIGLHDAETMRRIWIDTSSKKWRQSYEQQAARFRQLRNTMLIRAGVDRIELLPSSDYVSALTTFFRQRARRLKL